MKTKQLYLLALLSITFIACNKKESKPLNFDYGKVENSRYENSYFKFKLQVPANWVTLSQEQNKNLMNSERANKKLMDDLSTVNLLTASQFEIGKTDSAFNPSLTIIAENLKGSDRVNNGTDYLMFTRKALETDGVKREYPDKATVIETINGTEFSTMRVVTNDAGISYTQKFNTIIINGFAVTFIQTYANEDERIVLEKALGTIQFK